MTNTFIEFTKTRKEQIDYLRERLMTERPERVEYWGGHYGYSQPLHLADYVVYAALRGADYRKGDASVSGRYATEALSHVIRQLTYWVTSPSTTGAALRARWFPEHHGHEQWTEMLNALRAELEKWKDAPSRKAQ